MTNKKATTTTIKKAKVYVDGANVFYTQRELGWSIDWKKFMATLTSEFQVIEWRYYTGVKPDDTKMASYLQKLDALGFTVITKPVKVIRIDTNHTLAKTKGFDRIYKSNFDVEIATDLAFDRSNLEIVILLSGDSDFEYIVKRLKDVGKKVVIFSSRKTLSWELKLATSEYHFIEDMKEKIAMDKK